MVMGWKKWGVVLAAAGIIGATAYGVYRSVVGVEPGPKVAYTLLNGTAAHTAELTGRVVLVNFWATSCASCLQEMPDIVSTHARFQSRGFETLAVAMSYDAPANVVRYTASKALPFRVAIDHDGSLARGFGDVSVTPTSVLLNRRGEIVERYVGRPDFAALHRTIDALLNER